MSEDMNLFCKSVQHRLATQWGYVKAEKQEPVAWVSDGTLTPLYAAPVHASDMSQERVDETAKGKHEDWYGQWQWQCGYERGWDNAMEAKREWVGLTEEEIWAEGADNVLDVYFARDIEAKLKEKNT